MDHQEVIKHYKQHFSEEPAIISAPGRINLIGEHTDYNHGFVLPAAIDKRMLIAIAPTEESDLCSVKSLDFNEEFTFQIDNRKTQKGWRAYIEAMVAEAVSRKLTLKPFNCVFTSEIPLGSGLSSSAALCCGFLSAFNLLNKWELSKLEICKMAQATEHRLGANVGLMDQFAVVFGKKDQVIRLDCLDYSYDYFPLNLTDHTLVLINSRVTHEIAESGYNDRRDSCERVLAAFQQVNAAITTLRDITSEMLLAPPSKIDPNDLRRVEFVLEENNRVQRTTAALKEGRLNEVADLMYQSHSGLSKEYEVSCPELDLLVNLTRNEQSVLGSRMMGGGFGGCTINLVEREQLDSTISGIMEQYYKKTNIEPEHYLVSIEGGVELID